MFKIGHGYDLHRLVKERKLILGGVEIQHDLGLLGHSDADVLLHAVMDSLLGAAGLYDIGYHFPDTDDKFKGISSMDLLKEVKKLLEDKCYSIGNIDATIIAQKPKLRPYIDEMIENIAKTCEISKECVNIKATTEEGLGITGKEEAITAHAVSLIYKQ